MGLYQWRLGKGVYWFDPTVYDSLMESPTDEHLALPVDVFRHLPEYCIYVPLRDFYWNLQGLKVHTGTFPGDGFSRLSGIFAFLDHSYDQCPGTDTRLIVLFDDETEPSPIPFSIPLVSEVTIASTYDVALEGVDIDDFDPEGIKPKSKEPPVKDELNAIGPKDEPSERIEGWRWVPVELKRTAFAHIAPLLIYICCETAEFHLRNELKRPTRAKPVKTKQGPRYFQQNGAQVWEVGVRIGAALRSAGYTATNERPREPGNEKAAHLRKAHWHSFWTGRQSEPKERKLTVRWLPPIPVKMDASTEVLTTVHKVD